MKPAIANLAGFAVVNSVAVAEIQAICCAEAPNRVLNEPWKNSRECRVDGARVDLIGNGSDDLGAASLAITRETISVGLAALVENASPMEEIMDEGIYGDHRLTRIEPSRPISSTHQEGRKRHC